MQEKAHMVRRINYTKARLLRPFAKRYRIRASIASAPEALRIIAPFIIVTNDRKLAFVKNSKAGCTSVAHALYYHNYGKWCEGPIHAQHNGLIQGGDFVREGVQALTKRNVYKFTFVRNPTERAISAFHNFVLERTNRSASKHLNYMSAVGYNDLNSPSDNFDAFLNYIEYCFSISKHYTDPHFRLQTINIAYGSANYNHIGRLENYSEEMRYILHESGVWSKDHSNILKIKSNTSKANRYTPSDQQLYRLKRLYRDDYETLNYIPDTHDSGTYRAGL